MVAAEALLAYRGVPYSDLAMTGALLEAEHFQDVRRLAGAYLKPKG